MVALLVVQSIACFNFDICPVADILLTLAKLPRASDRRPHLFIVHSAVKQLVQCSSLYCVFRGRLMPCITVGKQDAGCSNARPLESDEFNWRVDDRLMSELA